MTNLINSATRFALNAEGRIMDYLTGRWHEAVGVLKAPDGHWHLPTLKGLLERGEPITHALIAPSPRAEEAYDAAIAEKEEAAKVDKVAQANKDFEAAAQAEIDKQKAEADAKAKEDAAPAA